ncbi:hypothetical protein ACVR08_01085 [Streptococcus caballi]
MACELFLHRNQLNHHAGNDGITTENLIGSTGPLFLYSGTKLA